MQENEASNQKELKAETTVSEEVIAGETPSYAKSIADNEKQAPRQTQLTRKEMVSLKRHNYGEAVKKFDHSFVVLNKRTGMVVEMRAATSWHAVTMIGWKHKHCRILQVIDHSEEKIEIAENDAMVSPSDLAAVETATITISEEENAATNAVSVTA